MQQNRPIIDEAPHHDSAHSPALIAQGVRYVEDSATGELWFVARDVCARLGTEAENIPKILDQDEYRSLQSLRSIPTIRGINNLGRLRKDARMLSEPGLYSLALRSRKPEAENFRRWVSKKVLPRIRKDGVYFTPTKATEIILSNLDAAIALAKKIKADRERQARHQQHSPTGIDVTPALTTE